MQIIVRLAGHFQFIAALSVFFWASQGASMADSDVIQADISLREFDGSEVRHLSDFNGRIVVLDFFDGIPNFVEFLLRGFSPQGADRLPTLEVDPENDQYFQFVVQLRPNVEHAMISVQLAPSLSSSSWTEAVTVSDNIIVDQSVPEVVKVKLKRSLGSMFVRLKGVQF